LAEAISDASGASDARQKEAGMRASADIVNGVYEAFRNGDVPAVLAHVWQVRDGKVVRFQYTDTRQWAAAAGLLTQAAV
jgi:ketosteroid isomerase-like protein